MILRHFHIGSEILQFVASNVPGVQIPLHPLRPANLKDLIDNVFLQHDLNIYNFLIRLNREMKAKGVTLTKQENLKFECITDGPFAIDQDSLPKRRSQFSGPGIGNRDLYAAVSIVSDGQRFLAGLQFAAARRDRRDLYREADGRLVVCEPGQQ